MLNPLDCQSGGAGSGDPGKKCRFWQLGVRRASTEMVEQGDVGRVLAASTETKGSRVGDVAEEECPNQHLQKDEQTARNPNGGTRPLLQANWEPPGLICRSPNCSTAQMRGIPAFPFEDRNTEAQRV